MKNIPVATGHTCQCARSWEKLEFEAAIRTEDGAIVGPQMRKPSRSAMHPPATYADGRTHDAGSGRQGRLNRVGCGTLK